MNRAGAWARAARLVLAGLASLLAGGAVARAGDAAAAAVGFDGVYRTGSWTPLVIPARDDGTPAVRLWVADADGESVGYEPVGGSAPGTTRFRVRFGRPDGVVVVERSDGTRDEIRLPAPFESTTRVLLVLGDMPGAERAARLMQREDGAPIRVATLDRAGHVGPSALDLDAADAVIACGRAVASAPPDLVRALDAWVRRGGKLVLPAGPSATEAVFRDGPAAGWLPGPAGGRGSVARMVPLRRGSALETYAKAGRPLDRGALADLEVPLVADPEGIDGSIEAWEGQGPDDLPLVVRRALGFGTVTWAGIDLDRSPFRNWQGTDTLVVQLLGGRSENAGRSRAAAAGSLDLGGQVRYALDRFDGVRPVPFEVIAGLALLYVACLWPLEWWLVSRSGIPRLAWLTLPALVAAFTGLAWWTATRSKAVEWRVRHADMVDIDLAGGAARGVSYLGLWSPENTRVDIGAAARSPAAGAGATVSWYGLTGRGIGAVDSPTSHPSLATAPYHETPSFDRLTGVPLAASSSRVFEAEWEGPIDAPPVESTLRRDAQGTLRGLVTNRLPFPLERAALVHAGWHYDVGTLAAGAAFDPLSGKGPRTLSSALTRASTVFDRTQTERWRLDETDVERILEIAGFHEAAGGASYTSLDAGRLARLDLSPLLAIDRAVLVGYGPAGTDWSVTAPSAPPAGDDAARGALVRILIPLGRQSAGTPAGRPPDADDAAAHPAPTPTGRPAP